jgi:hypothetical protein
VWELLGGWYVLEVRQDGVLVGSAVFSIRWAFGLWRGEIMGICIWMTIEK